jgi:hypothetical protein
LVARAAGASEQEAEPELRLAGRQARRADRAEGRSPERRARVREVRSVEHVEPSSRTSNDDFAPKIIRFAAEKSVLSRELETLMSSGSPL